MKNLHLLPTDKPSRLWVNNLKRRYELDDFPEKHMTNIGKHIYITSNEDIEDDDWVTNGSDVFKPSDFPDISLEYANRYWEKIILTTDPDLIKDGVQAIDDEFLEWFVKNPSCEYVEIGRKSIADIEKELGFYGHDMGLNESEFQDWLKDGGKYYSIIIPQEKPKQEPSDEMPEDYYPPKDVANAIWGACFQYQDLEENGIQDKIRNACFIIEKIYKNQKS